MVAKVRTFVKMKQAEIPKVRKELLEKQDWICPVCGQSMKSTLTRNIVIDHDHKTGVVRAALHRGCNKAEGSVMQTLQRWGKAKNLHEALKTAERLVMFWKLHETPQTEYIYYNHKTPEQKQEAAKKKRRKKK